LRIAAVTAE